MEQEASSAAAARAQAEIEAGRAADAALAAMERERELAEVRAGLELKAEDGTRARLQAEQARAVSEQRKLLAAEAALAAAAERARLERDAALAVRQGRADAIRRAELAGSRRQLMHARLAASLRRWSRASALAAAAFALGLGAAALWLQPAGQNAEALSRGPAVVQPETVAARPLALKIDADSAGFAARAASAKRKPR